MNAAGSTLYYVVGAIVLIAIIIVIFLLSQRARSARLRKRFGPEYERTARVYGDRAAAERELAEREERVKKFHLQELPTGARERYNEEWKVIQARFVDEPAAALADADTLLANVMRDRGYPAADSEQRAADLSTDHARVVQNYRIAHEICDSSKNGAADTEAQRQAMLHYRTLFSDLV
ncbi:MAG: hypothetical protein JOY69_08480 [Candidatus Eremiobacteraeota bacterium]|nr:hypothetical protein [Candidatus Eremiobacteraeota bacterium]